VEPQFATLSPDNGDALLERLQLVAQAHGIASSDGTAVIAYLMHLISIASQKKDYALAWLIQAVFLAKYPTEAEFRDFQRQIFLGADQLAASNRIAAIREQTPRPQSDFLIGYFSGTPTHQLDFEIASHALARIMREYPQVRLRLVGNTERLINNLTDFVHRIEILPFTNYLELQRLIAEVDLNLAPLQNTPFANCKSELKYFEAGIVGVPTIASPTYAMRQAITDGVNGFLSPNTGWYEYLKAAIECSPSGLDAIGTAARNQVLSQYVPEIQGPAICQIIRNLVKT
jgi:glycosyltransferase involved in cell wall biosynthesis